MIAIWKREWQAYFHTPVGYLFLGFFALVGGLLFFVAQLFHATAELSVLFSNLRSILLLSAPMLTMRVFCEDKHNKTDQLLLTSPQSISAIVMGKYLAAMSLLLVATMITGVYVAIISSYGRMDTGILLSGYIGFLLLGGCYVAIGCLTSALSENQLVAALLALGINFLIELISSAAQNANIPYLTSVLSELSWFSPGARYDNFCNGLIEFSGVFYFLTLDALLLVLTARVLQQCRSWRKAICLWLAMALIGIGGTCGLRWMEQRYTLHINTSAMKSQALQPETLEILQRDIAPLTIYLIAQEDDKLQLQVQLLAQQYASQNANITVETVDAVKEPGKLKAYQGLLPDDPSGGILVARTGESRARFISKADYYYSYTSSNIGETRIIYDVQSKLTSAMMYVAADYTPTIWVLQGHGEPTLEYLTILKDTLSEDNLEMRALELNAETVLTQDDVVLLNQPTTDLSDSEFQRLTAWLDAGGSLYTNITWECDLTRMPMLVRLLGNYQIVYQNAYVQEADTQTERWRETTDYLIPVLNTEHEITSRLSQRGSFLLFPYARALQEVIYPAKGTTYTKLLTSSAQATLYDQTDVDGPFTLGLAVDQPTVDGKSVTRIIATGAYNLLGDTNMMYYTYNPFFLSYAINWLVHQSVSVTLNPTLLNDTALALPDAATVWKLGALVVIGIPLLIALAGMTALLWRRKRT